MAKKISDFIAEADEIISIKTAAKKPAPQQDDIFKLAEELTHPQHELDADDYSLTEKIAHSIALVDTLINLPELVKIANFESKAKESGYSSEQISELFEKKASIKFKSVLDMIPMARG